MEGLIQVCISLRVLTIKYYYQEQVKHKSSTHNQHMNMSMQPSSSDYGISSNDSHV